jgi:hypothetical protein
MNEQQLFDVFLSDVHRPFSGWDFSYLTETRRMMEAPLPWSYAGIVLPRLRSARALLDMDTGGGEFLSRLQPLPYKLIVLHNHMQEHGYFDYRMHRFLILAQK